MSYAFVLLQYLLPRHWLTAVVWRLARVRNVAVKNFLISRFSRLYDVDLDEVRDEVPDAFPTFNDFFVRELAPGTRPIARDTDLIASPVDGTVSIAGTINDDTIIQAKGIGYTLDDLLAADLDAALAFRDGRYATIYLAPYNYHRVHAPFAGRLRTAHYVPGDLFSVNEATVARLPGLFRRNERLVMHFDTVSGPAVLIFVGALNVGSITTPWTGEVRPRKSGVVEVLDITRHPLEVGKGDLLGWFNMGSTVIVLLPPGTGAWRDGLDPGTTLRMGEAIGNFSASAG